MKTIKLPLILLFTLVLAVFSTSAQESAKMLAADGTVSYMEFKAGVKADNGASLLAKSLNASENDKFSRVKSEADGIGMVHDQYQQYYKGVKVEFGTYKVHSKGGEVVSINGEFAKLNLNTKPSLNEKAALAKAIASVGATKYMWESDASLMPKGELVIVNAKLAYKFDVYAEAPLSRADIYVSAENGEIVFKNATIKHANATGSADTRYSGTQSIGTGTVTGGFTLSDATRGLGISTFNCNTGKSYTTGVTTFVDADNNWTAGEWNNTAKDNAALDAQWGAQKTYDYFMGSHNRNSYDNAGAAIKSYVHYDRAYDNAFWNGSVMTYGDGSDTYFDALTSIDVAAHEIGHAVCEKTAGLVYQNESGAMNEGFSDIWGACVEAFAKAGGVPTNNTWLIGEDIERRAGHVSLRSMSNPNVEGQPDTYKGTMWYTGTGDNGGVHYNSGVLNHWFYRLSAGGSGSNDLGTAFNVSAIGIDKAAKIAYRTESVYLTSSSNYQAAANYGVKSAQDLYGIGSAEALATAEAFKAVGLTAVIPAAQNTTCGTTTTGISVGSKKWMYYSTTVPTGATNLTVKTTGSNGDIDLYIKAGTSNPTTRSYTAMSAGATSTETASKDAPASGAWRIGLYGYAAATGVTLQSCTSSPAIAVVKGDGTTVVSSLMFDSEEQGADDITVYPNPASDMVKITLGFDLSENAKVKVVSVTGQEMMSIGTSELSEGINVSALPKGVYMVTAHDGKSKVTAKFIKQ